MTDYLRPASQWADDTGVAPTDLLPWSFEYDPVTRTVTLIGFRRRIRAGLVHTSGVLEGDTTTRTWALAESVNGAVEMQVALYGDRVLVFPPTDLPTPVSSAPATGNDFNLLSSDTSGNFALLPVG